MNIFEDKNELSNHLAQMRAMGKTIGFVPTMGALHQGHLSLIQACDRNNDICVVSIFVNPTQFNRAEDLQNYPSTIDMDLELLKAHNCDIVFTPSVKEMYSENEDVFKFNFGTLGEVMEGKDRPGHFDGVATIVKKLFEIVMPNNAYFGKKDYQQLVIIKALTKHYGLSPRIIGCEIIRENDGLAMSSRNVRLTNEQRKEAPLINQTLKWAKKNTDYHSIEELKNIVIEKINSNKLMQVVYFEITDEKSLLPIIKWDSEGRKIGFIVVEMGVVRLIDNVEFF